MYGKQLDEKDKVNSLNSKFMTSELGLQTIHILLNLTSFLRSQDIKFFVTFCSCMINSLTRKIRLTR